MPKLPRGFDNSVDDDELFQREVGDVNRLHHNQAYVKKVRVSATSPSVSDDAETRVERGQVLSFRRSGIQTTTLQNLRRGRFPIEATLDLHGLTTAKAHSHLVQFVQRSQKLGRRAIRIIHGKGHGSKGQEPVLKASVNRWLREFPAVLAFCSSPTQHGGTGAVDVLIRR